MTSIVPVPVLTHSAPVRGGFDYSGMMDLAAQLVTTGFLPVAVKTPAQAVAIILTGQELGLGPMQSLRSIFIVQGKPTLSADLQLALFKRGGGRATFTTLTDERAVLDLVHANGDKHTETFTLKDAGSAGVTGNPTWKKFPKAMLRSRAITAGLKSVGFEPTTGVYDPEELGVEVENVVVESVAREAVPDGAEKSEMNRATGTPTGHSDAASAPSPKTKKAALSQKNINALIKQAGGDSQLVVIAASAILGKSLPSAEAKDWPKMDAAEYGQIVEYIEARMAEVAKLGQLPDAIVAEDLERELQARLKEPQGNPKMRVAVLAEYENARDRDEITVELLHDWLTALAK